MTRSIHYYQDQLLACGTSEPAAVCDRIVMPTEYADKTDTIKSNAGASNKKKGNFNLQVDQIITAKGDGT